MGKPPVHSLLFDGIATWLVEQGLKETTLAEIVQGLGQRLVAGGIAIYRINIGGLILHPTLGAMDITWEAPSDEVIIRKPGRGTLQTSEFQDSPFFAAVSENLDFQRFKLEKPVSEREFPIFSRFREAGITDYLVFRQSYGRMEAKLWTGLPPGIEGALSSFATCRIGGFTDAEIEYLNAVNQIVGLVIKTKTGDELSGVLLDTYLGKYTGRQVLKGIVERGDGRIIDCVLWYCDLRASTELADKLSMQDYLKTLDEYFDCTAGAVLDHGGEVLKFIGDAVMAIFPISGDRRPESDMAKAALATAREAIKKIAKANDIRTENNLPQIQFGISLHVGQVMYGNVGTARRLDFTVIGPAANEASRLEGLCKLHNKSVIASAEFERISPEPMTSLGLQEISGRAERLEAFTFIDDQSQPNSPMD